jgi:hypothetical protein
VLAADSGEYRRPGTVPGAGRSLRHRRGRGQAAAAEVSFRAVLAARRLPLLFGEGMFRHGQPNACTFLSRVGMRIIRNLITYRDAWQVGALLDIKGQAGWPPRFLGRRDRRWRGRLRRPGRTGLVLITHRSHPLRQNPGVPVHSQANPATLHPAAPAYLPAVLSGRGSPV